MHLDKALPDPVSLFHDDFEWIQHIDYEHVPFRCRRCHAHGHLFRDFPLKNAAKKKEAEDKSEANGFTKVTNRKRHIKKPSSAEKNPIPSLMPLRPTIALSSCCSEISAPLILQIPPTPPPSHPPPLLFLIFMLPNLAL